MDLVLASESPYRRELLDRLGLPYRARAHQCDERSLPIPDSLEEQARSLAIAKAQSLRELEPDALILGSDQIAELDGKVLHKPGTKERAVAQLERMQGKSHRLLTAVALSAPTGGTLCHLEIHRLYMRSLTREEIVRYVDRDMPLDCCGSYKIERLGVSLLDAVDGADDTAITGLPLIATCRLLRQHGISLP